ncbi:MAG: dihydrofolate reductase [Dysgonamonadaceae bacterium]|jgi:dihydrofolate reductase|nr:dihydrofolate reductase [Dysgonamonadaceae bacterium]
MLISIIAALGRNSEIGKGNNLLCHLPADLKHFKEITSGHTVIMGRKTFESLPNGALPNRRNIVLSRDKNRKFEGAEVHASLFAMLQLIDEEEVFVIGGARIYEQVLPVAGKLYLTKIDADFPGADVFFPPVNFREWKETRKEAFPSDEKNPYPVTFLEYERCF